jgi:heme/copper-type cytochrome/quinol oxidase subunit 1
MRDMVLARTLTLAGAVALATASVSTWFSYDYECGWTCYSPLPQGERDFALTFAGTHAPTAFAGLGTWIGAMLVIVVLAALAAFGLSIRGRRVPWALALVAAAGALAVVVRVVTQPDLTARHVSNRLIELEPAAYAGTAAAIVAALGVILLAGRRRLESPVA